MKITAVIGSYHRGNTYGIVKELEQQMKIMGDVEFEYIFLTEIHLEQCRGCFVCLSRGEDRCPLRDSFSAIEEKLMASDGAVFASPNYACGVTALMKKLIERMAYIGHRPKYFGKYMVTVATSGGPVGLKQTLANLNYFAGGGFISAGSLGIATPPAATSSKTLKLRNKKIRACAKTFYNLIKEGRVHRPSWGSVIQFSSFGGIYRNNPRYGEAQFPADMAYWRNMGWLEKRATSYTVYPGPVKRLVGFLFEKIIGATSKSLSDAGEKSTEQ